MNGDGSIWNSHVWDTFGHFVWSMLTIFLFVAYLIILFYIVVDLFWRDHTTSGWIKALWVIFLIIFPYITALVYIVARGQGMAVRAREQAASLKRDGDAYIRDVAGRSPTQEIAHAKELLDAGAINQGEFDSIKAKALG